MERIIWLMELKEDEIENYIKIHKKENVWPEIIQVNKKAGVIKEEIAIFKNLVFIYLEVEDKKKMLEVFESDEGLKRWNAITLAMTKSVPELNESMKELPLIFSYENGKLMH
ncbi:MAG TPA: L-rhamnose mutarotase [Actinobacteria bacterium]|jgi:L-rhamnose mutarotase|nr:L-rhamnose mutarotase [Actinomycetota bacterium]